MLKSDFEYSTYLDCVPFKYRICLTKLRLSSHTLRIESGRYGNNRVEHNHRYCLICNSGDIEDEFHFVCVCNAYTDQRRKYLNKNYYRRPSMIKFVELLQSNNKNTQLKLCKFLYESFTIRKNVINRDV